MSGLRNLLRAAILRILSDRKPRKAKDLVVLVRSDLGRDDIDKHEINSILYRDLSDEVRCDAAFQWQMIERSTAENTSGLKRPRSRAESIRTIYRLRAGLPPAENLENFTVGAGKLVATVRDLLKPGAESTWAIVRGDYGGGKTHALTLFTEMARREGYATCHLSADGYANALNHPQRFLPSLLATLEIPQRPTYGYTDLLYDVLSDAQLAGRLLAIVNSHLPESTSVASEIRTCIARIVELLENDDVKSDLWMAKLGLVTSHLTGDSIRHLSATPSSRRTSYHLLFIARDLLLEVGIKGVALAIDEVESISTKLPNARSRQGAMRVLAGFCRIPQCRVVLALTPDAFREILSDVSATFPDSHALSLEDVPHWVDCLTNGSTPVLDCNPLTRDQRTELVEAVREAYEDAFGQKFASDGFHERWNRNIELARDLRIPVRQVVRRAIDILDTGRYSAHVW